MESAVQRTRRCGDTSVEAGRVATQLAWYEFALRFVKDKTVLDVGCGLGAGLAILAREATAVLGHDVDPRLAGPLVLVQDIGDFSDKSFDVVTFFDVVEHVEDPLGLVAHCARIARIGFFLTTPNWTASRCRWPYHLREYKPQELEYLLCGFGKVTLYKGTPGGDKVYAVRHRWPYYYMNDFRTWLPTSLVTRCLNRILPSPCRIHSHLGAWVALG